jgi:hypothetical protein
MALRINETLDSKDTGIFLTTIATTYISKFSPSSGKQVSLEDVLF